MVFSAHDRIDARAALDFSDITLEPDFQQHHPDQISLKSAFSASILLHIPYVSLPSVTDAATAIHMAQQGGIGILPCHVSASIQADQVRQVKRFQAHIITDVMMVTPETSIIEALEYKQRYGVSLLPVIEGGTQFLAGFIELSDDMDAYNPEHTVSHYISEQELPSITESPDMLSEAYALMDARKIDYVAVIDNQHRCIGLIRKSDKDKAVQFPNATIDDKGSLRVAAMVGTGPKEYDRVNILMDAGVDAILVYNDHGHSKDVLDMITFIRRQRSAKVDVIAGNIMTEQAAIAMIDAGANGILIGFNQAYRDLGINVPAISSIMRIKETLSLHHIPLMVGHMDIDPLSITDEIKSFASGACAILSPNPSALETHMVNLRRAIAFTGCADFHEFGLRSRFVKTAR